MYRKSRLPGLFLAAIIAVPSLHAQDAREDIRRGREIWDRKGCGSCHGLNVTYGGPALAGVTERRSREWLYQWLRDSKTMVRTDSIARGLKEAWKMAMPSQGLSREEVDALLAFLADRERRLGGEGRAASEATAPQ